MAPVHRGERGGGDPHEEERPPDRVGGHAADDERHDREVQHLAVVCEQRGEMGMPAEPADCAVGLVPGKGEQQREEHGGGGGEPELASEREPEPEPGPLVLEQPPEVEAIAQARDRVEDPERPHHKHQREQPLLPRS